MSGLSPQVAMVQTTPASYMRAQSVDSNASDVYPEEGGKIGGVIALIGGCLLQLTLGSLFCYGNLAPYIASYFTYNDYYASNMDPNFDLTSEYNSNVATCNWIFFIFMTVFSSVIVFGGAIETHFGPTITIILASLLVSIGMGCTYFALIYNSYVLLIITYGVLFGCGAGIGYPVLVIVCMRWFPNKKGIVCGVISAVFGSGAFLFDTIQMTLVNPDNLSMNTDFGYTLQDEVIDNIPFMFAYIAAIMLTMQIVSIASIRNPPWFVSDSQRKTDDFEISRSQLLYEKHSLTLCQTLSFAVFWELWVNNFLYCIVLMFITSEWKIFAMNYLKIENDQFLSIVGSIASLCNGLGRFLWGIFYDFNKSFRISMGLQTCIITIFVATLPLIKYIDEGVDGGGNLTNILFSIWLCSIWSCVGCEYAFLPSVIIDTFGAKHTGSIVGVFVFSESPSTLIIVLLTQCVFKSGGQDWLYYCLTIAACSLGSTILSILYRPNRINRKQYLSSAFLKVKSYNSINNNS